jgi:hypothetical protein
MFTGRLNEKVLVTYQVATLVKVCITYIDTSHLL